MANMASVAYVIEGPEETLKKIEDAIVKAIQSKDDRWNEYTTCLNLGFSEEYLDDKRLGGEICDPSDISNGVLRFSAEERWGLQDFVGCLEIKFPDIKAYWCVEESGCEVYCTNDKEGKYFPDRYQCEICQDDFSDLEYFRDEESMYKWLSEKTGGRVHDAKSVEKFNSDYEEEALDGENYIIIHQFEVIE